MSASCFVIRMAGSFERERQTETLRALMLALLGVELPERKAHGVVIRRGL